ncbi:MAG TPA: hypothetical protein VGZ92_11605 [Bradyrhizobium sp.]|nr:hypothetical protein [Bradyrhizobium sp.]
MGQVIADAPGNGKSVILNNDVNATCGIAGGSCIDSDKTPFAQRIMRHPSARGATPLWITAAFLATTWASETQAFPEARHAQADASASARHATAARILGLGRTAGDGDFTTVQASRRGDKSVQLAQTTTSDTRELQQAVEQEHGRAEKLARELAVTRRDLELLLTQLNRARDESARVKQAAESEVAELRKALQQERDRASRLKQESERDTNELRKSLLRDRAERLERDLAATRRDVEPRTSPAAKAGDDATQLKQAAESTVVELRKSLQQERDRAGRLEQDLVAARRGVETQTALAAKASGEATQLKQAAESGTSELRKSLQQERERAERLEQDLAAARRDVETQTALAAKAGDDATQLKQAAGSGAVELRKSLRQEQERAERLEQDLAAARHDVETQTAQAAKASDEATRLKQVAESGAEELKRSLQQEHDRAEALAQDLSMARTNLYAYEAQARKASDQAADLKRAAESAALELRKSLQQERERAERLEQDLAAARRDVETQSAQAAKVTTEATELKQTAKSGAVELRKSLQQERERAVRLEQDLAAARRDVETQTALAAKAGAAAAQLKQLADSGSEELRISLQQERDTAARLERDLAFERNTKAAPAMREVVTANQIAQDKPLEADATKPVGADQASVAAARGAAPPNPEDAAETARLVARASVLLGRGDIGSARIVLERAVEAGNAQASFTLAETYDPRILPRWGTYGTRGDATKARDLYAKAEAGGIKEAKARFDSLRR